MSHPAVDVAVLFRTPLQLALVQLTHGAPHERWLVADLARRTARPHSTVSREVARGVRDSLFCVEHEQGRRWVRADTLSPIFAEIAALAAYAAGSP
jgi:hypothetical protein